MNARKMVAIKKTSTNSWTAKYKGTTYKITKDRQGAYTGRNENGDFAYAKNQNDLAASILRNDPEFNKVNKEFFDRAKAVKTQAEMDQLMADVDSCNWPVERSLIKDEAVEALRTVSKTEKYKTAREAVAGKYLVMVTVTLTEDGFDYSSKHYKILDIQNKRFYIVELDDLSMDDYEAWLRENNLVSMDHRASLLFKAPKAPETKGFNIDDFGITSERGNRLSLDETGTTPKTKLYYTGMTDQPWTDSEVKAMVEELKATIRKDVTDHYEKAKALYERLSK